VGLNCEVAKLLEKRHEAKANLILAMSMDHRIWSWPSMSDHIWSWPSVCFLVPPKSFVSKASALKVNISLSMKEGSLFCFVLFCSYEIHWRGMLEIMFLVSLEKLWMRRCACMHGLWFHDNILTLRCKSSWILNDFFTENEIKLNHNWEFRRNWNGWAFGVLGKILMSKI